MLMHRSAELDLVGPDAVAEAFSAARTAAFAVSESLDRLLEQGMLVPDEYPPISEEVTTFNRAIGTFTEAARHSLNMD